jgi:hypothetical protein
MKSHLWLTADIGLLFMLFIGILYSVTYVNINANIQSSGAVALGDFDNDGDLDLMRLPYLSRNEGNDLFIQTPICLPNSSTVDFGDYNNDGFLDILISGSSPGVFRNNGDGTFTNLNEVAFYDALGDNDSAVAVLGDDQLRKIAQEIAKAVRNNVKIDWAIRENVRAEMRVIVKRILCKYRYPLDKQTQATELVLEQAELICRADDEDML